MKKHLFLLLGLACCLCACHPNNADSLIGTWTVDKVNVQFDEQHNTPELVRQIGEMERQNSIVITADSILTFKSLDTEQHARITLDGKGVILCGGEVFGQWKEGQIVTRTPSPLGEVVVSYRKK